MIYELKEVKKIDGVEDSTHANVIKSITLDKVRGQYGVMQDVEEVVTEKQFLLDENDSTIFDENGEPAFILVDKLDEDGEFIMQTVSKFKANYQTAVIRKSELLDYEEPKL